MILSSRCGRGRLARMENSFSLLLCASEFVELPPSVFLKMLRRFRNRVTLNQNIFTAEFILRIAAFRRISVRLNPVMEVKMSAAFAQRCIDLLFRPDIKCAFLGLEMAAVNGPLLQQDCRHLRQRKSRLPSMPCRGRRNRECRVLRIRIADLW